MLDGLTPGAARRINLLNQNADKLGKSFERLASSSRIPNAAADAAGMAIANSMTAQIRGASQANGNVQDGINYIQTADAGLGEIINVLHRMRELSVQAANDTYTDADRQKIQAEIHQLSLELDRIPQTTEFNGITPLLLPPAKRLQGGTVPGNQADIELVIDGSPNMAVPYMNLVATFQAVRQNLEDRGIDLGMSIAFSGIDPTPPPFGSPFADNLDGVRLIQDSTPDETQMKAQLAYTIAPLQFMFGHPTTTQDNYNALLQSSGVNAGVTDTPGISEGVAIPTGLPSPPAVPVEAAYGKDTPTRRAGVSFFQILLTNNAPQVQAPSSVLAPAPSAADPAREAQTAALLSADPNLHVVVGNPGGAGGAVASAYDQIVTDTGGFFFDLNSNAPADYIAIADQIQAMLKPVPSTDPTNLVVVRDAQIHAGANEAQTILVTQAHVTARALGLEGADASTRAGASHLIGTIDTAMQDMLTLRSELGAQQNRLEHSAANLGVAIENQSTSFSRIHDTDMAAESAELTRRQILMQATTAMAAQGNQMDGLIWNQVSELIGGH
jgi:flagellin